MSVEKESQFCAHKLLHFLHGQHFATHSLADVSVQSSTTCSRLPDSTKGKVSETLQLNTKTPGMNKMFISRCSLQFLQQPVLLLTSRFANLFAIARSPARSRGLPATRTLAAHFFVKKN